MEPINIQETTKAKATPRDVFLQLLGVGLLYVSAIALIALLFQYVNYLVPDPLSPEYYGISGALRGSLSTIVIVFPVYVLLARYFQKESLNDPSRREIKIRKWLVYLTLFISAITVIIDLVMLVNRYLGGELSARFGLQVCAVLLVAGGVFWYYLWDLKRPSGALAPRAAFILRAKVAAIAAVIVGGFFLAGSPANQRLVRFDQQRINDLQMIQQEVINYWQRKDALPATLDDLSNDINGYRPSKDPETQASYEYAVKSSLTFELCADFKTSSEKNQRISEPMRPYGDPYQQNWDHAQGRVCFTRTIDPELYRPIDGSVVKPIPAPVN